MKTAGAALRRFAGALALSAGAAVVLPAAGLGLATVPDESALEQIRASGDTTAERQHVWGLVADFTRAASAGGAPLFETWHGEGELFGNPAPVNPAPGIAGFYRTDTGLQTLDGRPDIPVLTYTLYNDAAFRHIVDNRLNQTSGLADLLKTGPADTLVAGDRSVPQFPASSVVMKTVWWPVAPGGVTAMPVWDPGEDPPLAHGNPYTTWQRVVAVDPSNASAAATVKTSFAGTEYPAARHVPLDALFHVTVDADMARRLMADPSTAKAMTIALGRPVAAGDYLALVGINFATREIPEWIWVAMWWHDRPDAGPFAAGRPTSLAAPWRDYLMQVAFDTTLPAAGDGGPHVAFNPWLEGRFPDGGQGPGLASNCMACHARASYPVVKFLPVTRGAPDTGNDSAFAAGRLRTSFLWSLAMHAKP